MQYALMACGETTALVITAALVRPTKDVRQVEVKSVKKKWKQESFVARPSKARASRSATHALRGSWICGVTSAIY